jgi:hypothetical protein
LSPPPRFSKTGERKGGEAERTKQETAGETKACGGSAARRRGGGEEEEEEEEERYICKK